MINKATVSKGLLSALLAFSMMPLSNALAVESATQNEDGATTEEMAESQRTLEQGSGILGNSNLNATENGEAKPQSQKQDPNALGATEETMSQDGEDLEAAEQDSKVSAESTTVATQTAPVVSGLAHVQSYGWRPAVTSGQTVRFGTIGEAKRLESIQMMVSGGSVSYKPHVQTYGWKDWSKDGGKAGTEGEAKRLEAIRISLSDELSANWSIQYRCHVQTYGWLAWTADGEVAGSTGFAKRLEAVEVRIVPKGTPLPASDAAVAWKDVGIAARAHVQSIGWQNAESGYDVTVGTTGRALRMEAFALMRSGGIDYAGNIVYSAHVQSFGWMDWKRDNEEAGTTGMAKRMEAVKIYLTGELAEHYDIWYRVHSQKEGWLDWATNGQPAGTMGMAYRAESIQIKLLSKGSEAPGNTTRHFVQKSPDDEYPDNVRNISGNYELDRYLTKTLSTIGENDPNALKKAFDYTCEFAFEQYGHNPAPNDPPSLWATSCALEMYQNGKGNCYRYSSLFYWLARALGYDCKPVIGRTGTPNNTTSIHSWVEVYKDGKTFVCDPDLQPFYPSRNFFMCTYNTIPVYLYDINKNPLFDNE